MIFPVIKKPNIAELLKFVADVTGWSIKKLPQSGFLWTNIH